MTFLQFLAISPLIMVRFEKFKNRVTAGDLLYHFYRRLLELAFFGTLGALLGLPHKITNSTIFYNYSQIIEQEHLHDLGFQYFRGV